MTARRSRGESQERRSRSEEYWRRYQAVMPRYFWNEATRVTNLIISSAQGSTLTDADGKKYIDLTSQWSTNNLGNVPRPVLDATVQALERYGFLIYFIHPHIPMLELAERLLRIRPSPNLTRVFLELSGTGAAEGAVKYAIEAKDRPLILGFFGQYHGLSIAASLIGSLSAHERRHWEAFQGGALHAPYPNPYRRPQGMSADEYGDWVIEFIEDGILRHVAEPDRIAGVIFEPVACEAGIWIPPPAFARRLKSLCEANDWYFISDEVETGLGRTGKMWAIEHWGVAPDLMPIGKALSGGLFPIAAVLGSEEVMGEHSVAAGTTFGGHPAACAAASAAIDEIVAQRIPERSARLGAWALKRTKEWERFDLVGETRGLGLCIGVELVKDRGSRRPAAAPAKAVFHDCVENGTIPLWNYGDNVLRIQPPLTISEEELGTALDTMERALERHARHRAS